MKLKAKLKDIKIDYITKHKILEFEALENANFEINDDILDLEYKKHREKRSINANNMFYKFQNELARVLETSNQEMHLILLEKYSDCLLVPLLKEEDPSGYFLYYEFYKEATINGKEAKYYKVYKPTRDMNTLEFSRLLKGLLDDCKELGIDTVNKKEFDDIIRAYDIERSLK